MYITRYILTSNFNNEVEIFEKESDALVRKEEILNCGVVGEDVAIEEVWIDLTNRELYDAARAAEIEDIKEMVMEYVTNKKDVERIAKIVYNRFLNDDSADQIKCDTLMDLVNEEVVKYEKENPKKHLYLISGIEYDTDGEDITDLPVEIQAEIDDSNLDDWEIEETLSNKISEITGFCHFGFEYERLD